MTLQPDMIGIVVSDMAAALRFYRALGLAIPVDLDGESHVEIITQNGYRIAWDTEELMRSIHPEWVTPVGQRMTLAFKCENAKHVDVVYAELVAAGYHGHKPPWDAFWGQRYAVVADPDGTTVDLFAAL